MKSLKSEEEKQPQSCDAEKQPQICDAEKQPLRCDAEKQPSPIPHQLLLLDQEFDPKHDEKQISGYSWQRESLQLQQPALTKRYSPLHYLKGHEG